MPKLTSLLRKCSPEIEEFSVMDLVAESRWPSGRGSLKLTMDGLRKCTAVGEDCDACCFKHVFK
jgi:hypothetical protein